MASYCTCSRENDSCNLTMQSAKEPQWGSNSEWARSGCGRQFAGDTADEVCYCVFGRCCITVFYIVLSGVWFHMRSAGSIIE